MLSKSNEFISISISEDVLKVAYVKGSGSSANVTNVVFRDIKGVSELELPRVIISSLAGLNTKKADVFCVVPPSMITTKNIEIPSTSEEEIHSIVSLQAGRHTPFSRDEIQVGYVNIGVYKANYTKVLLVIANKNQLKKQLSSFERAGIKIKKVLFAPESIAAFYSSAMNLKADSSPSAIIDIGKNTTEFIVAFKGMVIASRSIPIGKTQFDADPSGAKIKIADEIKKTVEAYKTEDIEQLPGKYIVASNDNHAQQIAESIKSSLGGNVEVLAYIDSVKATKQALTRIASSPDNSFLDVIACSSQSPAVKVNLLPEELLLQKSIEAQGKEVFRSAILGFVILIFIVCTFVLRIYFHNSYLNKLKKNNQGLHDKVLALEKRSLKAKLVQNFLEERMSSLDTIKELYSSIPDEVYLTVIDMDEKGNISLQGISDAGSIVYNLGNKLKESKLFKSVEIKSTTSKKDRGKDATAFEITLQLSSADSKEDPTMKKAEE